VASNSPSEVIAAIGRFASNPTLAAAMGAAGHKSFLSNYNFETQAERLLQVLERES
jgi:glycosyltransferase involved in cell wall biosynthesis